MTKALITYEIPPMRGLNWTVVEDDTEAEHTVETVTAYITAEKPSWSVKRILINPKPDDEGVPRHLAFHFETPAAP